MYYYSLKPTKDNRNKKADTASYNMTLSSYFIFRIKTIQIEEEQSEKLTNNMKFLIFLAVTLGTLVTGLDSVSFEINGGGVQLELLWFRLYSFRQCSRLFTLILLFVAFSCPYTSAAHIPPQNVVLNSLVFLLILFYLKVSASIQIVKTSCNNQEI